MITKSAFNRIKTKARVTNTTINDATEETACPTCGTPLYLGDRAHFDGDSMYCSRKCARRHTLNSQIAATQKETKS